MADVTQTLTTALRVTGAVQMAMTFANVSQLVKTYAGAQLAAAAADVTAATAAAETAVAQQVLAVSMVASAANAAQMKLAMLALQAAEDAGIVASDGLAAANTALAATEWAVLGPIALIVLGIIAITAAIGAAVKGLQTFAEESKAAFQAAVVFKNLGFQTTPDQLKKQLGAVSQATGFQRPELMEEAGKLAATGVPEARIPETLKAIGDAARGTGKSFGEVGEAFEKGIMGKMRGLASLKINLQNAGTEAANLNAILRETQLRYEGAAEAFKQTLPGATENFQRSLRDLFSAIGEKFAPMAIRVLNTLASVIDFISDHIDGIILAINPVLWGMLRLMGKGSENPMGKVGHGGDPASERTAKEIAENTRKMADSVEIAVLGGSGTEVRGSFGFLQARLALAI